MNRPESGLNGAVVLVTGSASGIGGATVEEFARCNSIVYGVDRMYETENQTEKSITQLPLDVRDQDQFRGIVELILEREDRIDVLVNAAGIGDPRSFNSTTRDHLDEMMAVNFRGVWNGCQAVLPELLDSQGSIVNVVSIVASVGANGYAGYAASKGAVLSMTRSLAAELGSHGTRVNAVSPGTIQTPRTVEHSQEIFDSDHDPRLPNHIPLERIGQPDEVANCIRFLASDEASYVTGSEMVVDGGRSVTGP